MTLIRGKRQKLNFFERGQSNRLKQDSARKRVINALCDIFAKKGGEFDATQFLGNKGLKAGQQRASSPKRSRKMRYLDRQRFPAVLFFTPKVLPSGVVRVVSTCMSARN
jgi:hypothetical protein